jgi:hypothetical protein
MSAQSASSKSSPTARERPLTPRREAMKAIFYILDRLSENSTWRGLILVAVALGVKLEPELQNQIVAAGLGLVGTINIFRKEK